MSISFLVGGCNSVELGQFAKKGVGNNITGANLMELDRADLKEMGVAKLGDQIRIASRAKEFRTRECRKVSKRVSNRVCDIQIPSVQHRTDSCDRNP